MMVDFGSNGVWHYGGISLWVFIILIVLIGSFFSYMKTRSRNEVIREALRTGQPLDKDILNDLGSDDSQGGLIVSGLVTMAVAVGLIFLGYQIGRVEGESEIFEIMKGVAGIPGLIGLVLFISGLVQALTRPRK